MSAEKTASGPRQKTGLPGYKLILFSGLIVTFALPLIALLMPTVLAYFNGKIYDEFLIRVKPGRVSERILIVDVDEDSLRRHGQWPWPRYKIAAVLDQLSRAGAAAIGLDMMFAEKDRTSLATIQASLENDLNLSIDFRLNKPFPDNDRLLAEAISKSPAVLGYQFLFEPPALSCDCRLHPLNQADSRDFVSQGHFPLRADFVTCNLPLLAEKARLSGFFNVSPDADGILRSVPLVMEYKSRFYPSLALAAVMQADDIGKVKLIRRFDDYALILGRMLVPLSSRGDLLVNYRGKAKAYRYVSAAEVLAGRVPQESIRNKIVFVGTSAIGLKELRSTPTDPLYPGVEVHAAVADNLLTADFISRPAIAPGFELIAALLCGIFYVFATGKAGAMRSVMLVAIGAAGIFFISLGLFDAKGIFFSPILPLLVLIGNFATLNLLKFWREERKSRQQTRDLAQSQAAIIESMASLTETRDPETGGHIKRTQEYVRLLAQALRKHPAYRSQLTDETIDLLYKFAPLHDIGKVGISDSILLKPGRLSVEEFEEMKRHSKIGADVIASIQNRLGSRSFLKIAREIAHTHHEKWDGSGYPQGLKGEHIPLSGRLMALADMYDALTSKRVYKGALSHAEAVEIITGCAAASFDPQVFGAFLEIEEEFQKVALKFADPDR